MRAFVIALLACLTACTVQPPVGITYSAATDFTKYHTYSWRQAAAPKGMNPELYARLRTSIDRSLVAHKFTPADPAQFTIAFVLYSQDRVQVAGSGVYGGVYGYSDWTDPVPWHEAEDPSLTNIHRATLVILIHDQATDKLIWRGSVEKDVIPVDLTPKVVDQIVDAAVAQFPPDIRCTLTVARYSPCNF
jgi:hypothetical protein